MSAGKLGREDVWYLYEGIYILRITFLSNTSPFCRTLILEGIIVPHLGPSLSKLEAGLIIPC